MGSRCGSILGVPAWVEAGRSTGTTRGVSSSQLHLSAPTPPSFQPKEALLSPWTSPLGPLGLTGLSPHGSPRAAQHVLLGGCPRPWAWPARPSVLWGVTVCLLMPPQGGVFPSKGVCPCPSPRAPFIMHLAQSGHRGSLAGTAVKAEGRALGRWCECQGPRHCGSLDFTPWPLGFRMELV